MEPVVFRHFKLLNYLRKINLSLDETAALIRRLETDSCRPEDYEVLIRIVRAHTEVSADFLEAPPVVLPSAPVDLTKRKRRSPQRSLRRPRRS
jgi:hypothetical protein